MVKDDKIKSIVKKLKKASEAYHKLGKPIMSDDEYDRLRDELEKLDPNNKFLMRIGYGVGKAKNKCELPYNITLGSMNKFKNQREIDRWINTYGNNDSEYVIAEKIDGCSIMVVYDFITSHIHVYTRGDGRVGQCVDHIIKGLKLPKIQTLKKKVKSDYLIVRGEAVLSKKGWNEIQGIDKELNDPRSAVAGFINSQPSDFEEKRYKAILKRLHYLTYEIIYRGNDPKTIKKEKQIKIKKQYELLNLYGFEIVQYQVRNFADGLTLDELSEKLTEMRDASEYDMDGLVIISNAKEWNRKKGSGKNDDINTKSNPRYAFAFKKNDLFFETKVEKVEWNVQRHGKLFPRIFTKPVKFPVAEGAYKTLTKFSGFNAEYIKENKIGKGSIILVTLSNITIPHIVDVVKSTKADMPKNFIWKGLDAYIDDKKISSDIQQKMDVKYIVHFFSEIGVQGFKGATVNKFYGSGYTTPAKILGAKKEKLYDIEGVGEKNVDKLYDAFHQNYNKINLIVFMNACNTFEHLGKRKLDMLLNDNIRDMIKKLMKKKSTKTRELKKFIENEVKEGKGRDEILMGIKPFLERSAEFKELPEGVFKKIPKKKSSKKAGINWADQVIVFTGFRDKELQMQLENMGARVATTVSGITTMLIVKDLGKITTKISKAEEKGVKIYDIDTFKKLVR